MSKRARKRRDRKKKSREPRQAPHSVTKGLTNLVRP